MYENRVGVQQADSWLFPEFQSGEPGRRCRLTLGSSVLRAVRRTALMLGDVSPVASAPPYPTMLELPYRACREDSVVGEEVGIAECLVETGRAGAGEIGVTEYLTLQG